MNRGLVGLMVVEDAYTTAILARSLLPSCRAAEVFPVLERFP